jgi:DNA polymerase bacteriophage-type
VTTLYIDLETRSDIDLRGANVYRYVESPLFGILTAAYAVDDGPVEVLTDEREIAELVRQYHGPVGAQLVAHNAPFERVCLETG